MGERFGFGRNWRRFIEGVDESHVAHAAEGLDRLLDLPTLAGATFLDVGSGSGLSSLAARRAGATVRSFDYDVDSVRSSEELRRRFSPDDRGWAVEQGSILDPAYVASIGVHDVVYSWGVLHHTGAMWDAMDLATTLVAPGGRLAIAIYNDQGARSRAWGAIKRTYVTHPWTRPLLLAGAAVGFFVPVIVRDAVRGDPFRHFRAYADRRGMSAWTDLVDWIGGWPFEVATVPAIVAFHAERGFDLERCFETRALGCNELVFRRRP